MDTFIMKPKIDFAFKEIMEDETARTGFLSAVLHLDPSSIRKTRILNPCLRKFHEEDKLGILDVRVLLDDGTQVDTEIQLAKLKVWADRALFYLSKIYTDQASKGQKYNVLYCKPPEYTVMLTKKVPGRRSAVRIYCKFNWCAV